jgi:hypothetical protein
VHILVLDPLSFARRLKISFVRSEFPVLCVFIREEQIFELQFKIHSQS